jgi:hypothetical protein
MLVMRKFKKVDDDLEERIEQLLELVDPLVAKWKEAGFLTLPIIRQWNKYFDDPELAMDLFEIFGNQPSLAFEWFKLFENVDEVEIWSQVFDDPHEAYKWWKTGMDVEEAVGWAELGFSPNEAKEFQKLGISPFDLEEKPTLPKKIYEPLSPEEFEGEPEELYTEALDLLLKKLENILEEKQK